MKVLSGTCSCGSKTCTTTYKLEKDPENIHNIVFSITDDKHDLSTWVSLDKVDLHDLIQFLHKIYGNKLKDIQNG